LVMLRGKVLSEDRKVIADSGLGKYITPQR